MPRRHRPRSRNRLALRQRYERPPVEKLPATQLSRALRAALCAMRWPAALIDASGKLIVANERAAADEALSNALKSLAKGDACEGFRVERIDGKRRCFLVTRQEPEIDASRLIQRVAQEKKLTRQQSRVLELLAWGETNKAMAAAFGCTERTIEHHVSRLFDRFGVDSRAALVARFWTVALRSLAAR